MFARGVKKRRKPPQASPEKSRRRRSRQPAATSLLNDVRSPARRLTEANAHRLLSCESELRVRSWFVHRIYESVELGNASFDHQPPSKLVAPSEDPIVRTAGGMVK